MLTKTLLNKVYPLKSFVYSHVKLLNSHFPSTELMGVIVNIEARKNSRPICSSCGKKGVGYDTLDKRQYEFVPLWGVRCFFEYRPRRVDCKKCGVKVEAVPWGDGKCKLAIPYRLFLADWARKLSWKDVADSFKTSWENVFRSVKHVVEYGMEHRSLEGITAIGIDEVKHKVGHQYLTLVYQIDDGMRRLLHIGKDRKAKTLLRFFVDFGKERTSSLKVICTDMWKPYLKVINKKAPHCLNVLDRFHIRKHLNEGLDEVRKEEQGWLHTKGYEPVLKKSKWALMKNPENCTKAQSIKIKELMQYNLKSIKCYLYNREFEKFWTYTSATWAEKFFDSWCTNAMKSQIIPLKKRVEMLRKHKTHLLNWFHAGRCFSSGPVEGLNNRVKLTMRKSYGFRELDVLKIALYHQLGKLPQQESTHKFC